MRYVVLRDDDTNALMPLECLERLYRPFLDYDFPVNLAVIPKVSTADCYGPGKPEKFLMAKNGDDAGYVPIGKNQALVEYLLKHPKFKVIQHGCSHESVGGCYEFDHDHRGEIVRRLEEGMRCLGEAGLGHPTTFVAPYDRLSRVGVQEVARRYRILSTGWYELSRVPIAWWGRYICKKLMGAHHWRAGHLILLSHPGCQLSYHRSYSLMLQEIEKSIQTHRLTVIVTHWWEYFRDGTPDEEFIGVLHKTAAYLASRRDVRVISFDEVAQSQIPLN